MNGQPQGFEYELLHEYEHFLNAKIATRGVKSIVIFITVPSDQRIPLIDGRGDIAANEAITPQREKLVALTQPTS